MGSPDVGYSATTADKIANPASYPGLSRARYRVADDARRLASLLEGAEVTHDEHQTRAAVTVALQRGYPDLVNQYTASRPQVERDVDTSRSSSATGRRSSGRWAGPSASPRSDRRARRRQREHSDVALMATSVVLHSCW